jgi:hypothetical protein
MHELAMQIPIKVIGMLAGLPRSDQASLQSIFHKDMHADTAAPTDSALDGIVETAGWFNHYLDWRAEHPTRRCDDQGPADERSVELPSNSSNDRPIRGTHT